ncbi:TetR/AcrR family transcriptional regulator [Paraneptunicella aestuarii]|uniref:TetR/AcrR family transcriptional regulator n=1 Tax=Paraneptunicella aestuarii TaxID=2831148 RepID=UPI001E32D689|nr:TetR/AcrR family transcriptional regulator C-terminal domain-containing protein [Paraneptunicella aestuarii]UAA38269.1 TetR/AcrR family transcriptional regulator [Paraneptunicella aestuarii]
MNQERKPGAGRPKSEEKKHQILCAATDSFLECGFAGTSMDQVANLAGVSKQTVYSHFENKDTLYIEVIKAKCAEYQLDEEHIEMATEEPEQVLRKLGMQFIQLLLDPNVIRMYKMVIGEVNTTTNVAELFYNAGSQRGLHLVAQYLLKQPNYPVSEKTAFELSTLYFNSLKGEYHMKSMLNIPFNAQKSELEEHVQRTVKWVMLCLRHESEQQA